MLLGIVTGIFGAIILMSRVVSTRKMLHICIGPVFIAFVDFFPPQNIYEAIAFSTVPMSSAIGFLASKWLQILGFLRRIVTRKGKLQLTGVVVYGMVFALYPFWQNKYFKAGLLTLAFGDGFAAFGGCFNKQAA